MSQWVPRQTSQLPGLVIQLMRRPWWPLPAIVLQPWRQASFYHIELGAYCRSYRLGGRVCGWGEELRGRSKGGGVVGFIRLVTDTTYCIGHKSSYAPNLSFKQIILGGDASAVSLLSGGWGEGEGWRNGEKEGQWWIIETQERLTLCQESNGGKIRCWEVTGGMTLEFRIQAVAIYWLLFEFTSALLMNIQRQNMAA